MRIERFPFHNVEFVKSAACLDQCPILRDARGQLLPEVAVAGRSNVGKSSLLNSLFRRKLVKTSATPGKTQLLNFFQVDDRLACVDLPGYGFAKVPVHVRKQWGPMVQDYLNQRPALQLVLFLFDIRRLPSAEDQQLLEWIVHARKAMILVLTKVDKIKQSERAVKTEAILRQFAVDNVHYVHFSAMEETGRRELITMISDALIDEGKKDGTIR